MQWVTCYLYWLQAMSHEEVARARVRQARNGTARTLTIWDEIAARGCHEVALDVQMPEHGQVSPMEANRCEAPAGEPTGRTGSVGFGLRVQAVTGNDRPGGEW